MALQSHTSLAAVESLKGVLKCNVLIREFVFYPANFTLTKRGELQQWAGLMQHLLCFIECLIETGVTF